MQTWRKAIAVIHDDPMSGLGCISHTLSRIGTCLGEREGSSSLFVDATQVPLLATPS